jgi:hypothetical protein
MVSPFQHSQPLLAPWGGQVLSLYRELWNLLGGGQGGGPLLAFYLQQQCPPFWQPYCHLLVSFCQEDLASPLLAKSPLHQASDGPQP